MMIIKALTIENFKSIREPSRVEFKPITLLFGPNSTGKSTIVQALHYTREILEKNNADVDRVVSADESFDLGGFANIVHKHDLNLPIKLKFEISFSPLADLSDFFTDKITNAWIEFEIKWSNFLGTPLVMCTSVGLDGEFFARIICAEDGKRARIKDINFKHHLIALSEEEIYISDEKKVHPPLLFSILFRFVKKTFLSSENIFDLYIDQQTALSRNVQLSSELMDEEALTEEDDDKKERMGEDDDWLFKPSSWETLNDFFHTYFGGLTAVLRDELRNFRYIGPLRKTPPRFFSPLRTEDEARWSSGLAAWDVLARADTELIREVNTWLAREDRLKCGYQIERKQYKELDINHPLLQAEWTGDLLDDEENIRRELAQLPIKTRLFLRDTENDIEVLPPDIGVGISQLMPVMVASLYLRNGLVAIEQPELHLHPALQVAIGDLFIEQAVKNDSVFLLETHSEHLLLRLLRRIRETSEDELPPGIAGLTPEQLSVNFVEQTDEGIRIRLLQISRDGDSSGNWPKGFFDERSGELF
jgi:hypothetical protein